MSKNRDDSEFDRLLFVEGAADSMFYRAFLKHLGIKSVYVKEFKGKSNILKRGVLLDALRPDRLLTKQAVAIVIDADDNPTGTIQSLHDSLNAILGRSVHECEWSEGTPRVGFFVTPDGSNPGEIETLVWKVWSENPKHESGRDSVLDHLARMEAAGWPAKSPDKARISAFLAAAFDDDPRLGPGAREGLFDFNAPGFSRLRDFFSGF